MRIDIEIVEQKQSCVISLAQYTSTSTLTEMDSVTQDCLFIPSIPSVYCVLLNKLLIGPLRDKHPN